MSEETIGAIRYWHRQRQFAIAQRKRVDLAVGSFVRMLLGFRVDASDIDRKAVRDRAAAIISAVEAEAKGKEHLCADRQLDECRPIILASIASRAPFDQVERDAERHMRKLVRSLPIYPWSQETRGLGDLGLAQIIGEAGDLSMYDNPAKLWKRMGLAVMSGKRQGAPGANAGKDEWIAHGYSPARRSIMWNIGGSLLKAGGPYADLIRERKEVERLKALGEGLEVKPAAQIKPKEKDRCRSVGHIANRAQRYAEKRLLRDLWRAWREANEKSAPKAEVPPAESSGHGRGIEASRTTTPTAALPQSHLIAAE